MSDGAVEVAGLPLPGARTPVQPRQGLGRRTAQLGAQRLGDEPVAAEPLLAAIHRHEQARLRQLGELGRGTAPLEQGVAQRRAEDVDHGRAPEEGAQLGRQVGEQLVAHVLRDEPVSAAEPRQAGLAAPLAEEERRQRHGDRPALGALHHRVEVLAIELMAGRAQHRRRLWARERELARPQLDDQPLCAHAGDGQRRPVPGREGEGRLRRQVARDRRERLHGRSAPEPVRVVEHEHERRCAVVSDGRIDCRGDRGQEPDPLVAGRVGGHPRERARVVLGPLAQQRGLAVARRGGDDDDGRPVLGREEIEQARAAHQRPGRRARGAPEARRRSVPEQPERLRRRFDHVRRRHRDQHSARLASATRGCASPFWRGSPRMCGAAGRWVAGDDGGYVRRPRAAGRRARGGIRGRDPR